MEERMQKAQEVQLEVAQAKIWEDKGGNLVKCQEEAQEAWEEKTRENEEKDRVVSQWVDAEEEEEVPATPPWD